MKRDESRHTDRKYESGSAEPTWYAALHELPNGAAGFDAERMNRVLETARHRAAASGRIRRRLPGRTAVAAILLAVALPIAWFSGLFGSGDRIGGLFGPAGGPRESGGSGLLQALPGGEALAGTPNGCWWNIALPAAELLGRTVEVTATHAATGLRLTELPATVVDESMDYDGRMTRLSSRLEMPLAGDWTFELTADGEPIGDAVISIGETPWRASGTFKSDGYTLTGTEGRIGLLSPGFEAGRTNKYMWYLWGAPDTLQGSLRIVAVKASAPNKKRIEWKTAAEGELPESASSTEIRALPTGFSLPSSGLWQLIAVVDGRYFGSVFVEVR